MGYGSRRRPNDAADRGLPASSATPIIGGMETPGDTSKATEAGGAPNDRAPATRGDTTGGAAPSSAIDRTAAPTESPEPAVPRPMAAPSEIAGIRPTAPQPKSVQPAPAGRSSILPRIAAVLAMIMLAGVIGYVLAFVSAQMVDQSGSTLPAVASSVAASIAPSTVAPASVAPASAATGASTVAPVVAASGRASPQYHAVARNENLTSIAERYGVSMQALAAANGISNPKTIYTRQRLVIPGP